MTVSCMQLSSVALQNARVPPPSPQSPSHPSPISPRSSVLLFWVIFCSHMVFFYSQDEKSFHVRPSPDVVSTEHKGCDGIFPYCWEASHCICATDFFVHSAVLGGLGCFQILAQLNSSTTYISAQAYSWNPHFGVLRIDAEKWSCRLNGNSVLKHSVNLTIWSILFYNETGSVGIPTPSERRNPPPTPTPMIITLLWHKRNQARSPVLLLVRPDKSFLIYSAGRLNFIKSSLYYSLCLQSGPGHVRRDRFYL